MLLPEERLLRLMHTLSLEELAEMTHLIADLEGVRTQDANRADFLFNCIAAQIADHLSDEDADRFRSVLMSGGEAREFHAA